MSQTRIDDSEPAQPYDCALRWLIPSRSDPHVSYVVELDEPPGYSVCQCDDYAIRFGPLLAKGISPKQALQRGLVKQRCWQQADEVLKCWHILDAEKRLARSTIRAFRTSHQVGWAMTMKAEN